MEIHITLFDAAAAVCGEKCHKEERVVGQFHSLTTRRTLVHTKVVETTVRMPKQTCLRCDHTWVARTTGRPRCCAKCKSPYWDRPRKKS
jgi:hypothetical protein